MTLNQNGNLPRRLDAYIRVSSVAGREGDSFISPNLQEERIRAWAVANGHEIVDAWHELDVSGGTMDRPLLNEVMRRILDGETEGVVVYRLDRFGRTLVGALQLIQRIHGRGALFASVSDGFDITTETGRLVLNILLSIAQFERERMQENWRNSRTAAVKRGIHVTSIAPFGYRRGAGPINLKTGRPAPAPLEVDPVTGPAVTELFRRKAAGASWAGLREWLVTSEIPTVLGAPWNDQVVRRIIGNRVYLGIASGAARGSLPDGVAGAHPALVDEATWQAAQMRRGARHSRNESPSVVRGLLRCGTCRYSMSGGQKKHGGGQLVYACNRPFCTGRASITLFATDDGKAGLDEFVVGEMWEHLERIEYEGLDEGLDIDGDERERDELVARQERAAADTELEQALGRAAWLKHLAGLTIQIDEVQARIDEKLRRMGGVSGRRVAELRAEWGRMTIEQKRAIVAGAVQMIFVGQGKGFMGHDLSRLSPDLRRAKFRERVQIVWATDDVVDDVPRQGRRGYVIKPWVFTTDANPHEPGIGVLEVPVKDSGDTVG